MGGEEGLDLGIFDVHRRCSHRLVCVSIFVAWTYIRERSDDLISVEADFQYN
jgi:hypothetical protein